ncbi:DUF938 domain-containing protein [Litorimonas sp. RW-G-Af-16]|uniref:DUF938 domain-containing protein n=1 Tax=Litorimonas sp. RW-G-Af-16 TaxID=3241168 RepID=UPI00390CA096
MSDKPPIALEDRDAKKGRLFSPSAGRNKDVIADVLAETLAKNSKVLEIASGTGEHGIAAIEKRPDLLWQFSDPDAASRVSQQAWIEHVGLALTSPINLDVTATNWASRTGPYDAIFCANMIHIAPWAATLGLANGASACVAEGGIICLYGPFLEGEDSAPSNLDFDQSLKSRNPAWGVRDLASVKHIFAKHGFNQVTRRDMPKNNLFLLLSR